MATDDDERLGHIVGYWHASETYCVSCRPHYAVALPHIWQRIRSSVRPVRALRCCRCERVIAPARVNRPPRP